MRPKGVIVYKTPKPAFKIAPPVETGERQEPEQPQRPKGVLVKGDRPKPPNWKCYPMVFIIGKNIDEHGNWLGGQLPRCRVCEGLLHPNENHVCDGFKPKFVEMTPERHELWEAKREDIRASNYNRPVKCLGCHQVIEGKGDECLDNARWHDEHCCADMPSGRHWYTDYDPITGDNDGHECYEDEPEDDYCEGDDDGYDCD